MYDFKLPKLAINKNLVIIPPGEPYDQLFADRPGQPAAGEYALNWCDSIICSTNNASHNGGSNISSAGAKVRVRL